ncbi:hypothetical protein KBD75_01710 [Candidatus Woesebacteria bacterium]|nr:hypothetical protein [Candidatus Woesebacteria bacterium]
MEDDRKIILRAGQVAELVAHQLKARGDLQSITDATLRAILSGEYNDETINKVMELLSGAIDSNTSVLINPKIQ